VRLSLFQILFVVLALAMLSLSLGCGRSSGRISGGGGGLGDDDSAADDDLTDGDSADDDDDDDDVDDDEIIDEGVPDTWYCSPVSDWPAEWAALEVAVLELTNIERSLGANCGGDSYPPVGPLTMQVELRCSSRLHSQDMADRDFFAHDNPEGETPFDRIEAAGYPGFTMGENIAAGYVDAGGVVDGWMKSPGHCSNIMFDGFDELGVGYAVSNSMGGVWTQNFGSR